MSFAHLYQIQIHFIFFIRKYNNALQQKLQKLGGAGQGHKLQLSAEAGADGNTTSTKGDQNQSKELEEILRESMLKSEPKKAQTWRKASKKGLRLEKLMFCHYTLRMRLWF